MFYTKLAKIIAGFGLVIGALILLIAALSAGSADPATHRFSGQTIDNGFYYMIGAVALGVVAEISQSLAVIAKSGKQSAPPS
jgi:Na+/phosphate symporter